MLPLIVRPEISSAADFSAIFQLPINIPAPVHIHKLNGARIRCPSMPSHKCAMPNRAGQFPHPGLAAGPGCHINRVRSGAWRNGICFAHHPLKHRVSACCGHFIIQGRNSQKMGSILVTSNTFGSTQAATRGPIASMISARCRVPIEMGKSGPIKRSHQSKARYQQIVMNRKMGVEIGKQRSNTLASIAGSVAG